MVLISLGTGDELTVVKKNNSPQFLEGTIKRHPDGFGFFIPDSSEHADVFIPAHAMTGTMSNDRVVVRPIPEKDGRFRGDIIRILERAQKKVAGRFLVINDKYGIIKDEGKGWGMDLRIPLEDSMNAKNNELVAAEIKSYPENDRSDKGNFVGKVIQILGDATSALNDIKRVIVNQNIPDEFTQATLEEAKKFNSNPTEKDFAGRKDLRHLPIITIDGATAKDFDDAIYTEMTHNGFHLYVAIADVSHYVRPNTAIDKDAYERGTSVYFPNFVAPMIPEALSNGLCSLNPNVPRLALVAEMHFDFTGEMTTSQFYEGVIQSQARVTYGQAQEVIEGSELSQFNHVKDNILKSADLAKVLMAKRFKEGSLDLEVPETELVIDGTGEPIDVVKSERLFAHRLIEEMMLAANVAVAKYLGSKDIPSLYRIHEPPDPMKMSLLQKFIANLGSKAKFTGQKLQKQLTKALHEFEGKPQADVIHILTLRSMSQAKYTIDNVGHFGLGFDYYTHFTSPIRRYPDLIVHRLIKNQLGIDGYRLIAEDDLQTAGTWLSACEQRSAKSERQIQAIKKARFMQKLLGETYEGMISSVTKFGFFVMLKQYNIDGLVRIDDLGTEKSWVFDEDTMSLVSKKTGQIFAIGDLVTVTVSLVDIEQGQINFVLDKEALKQVSQKNKFDKKQDFKKSSHNDKKPTFGFKDKKFENKDDRHRGKNDKNKDDRNFDRKKEFHKDKPKKSLKLQAIEKTEHKNLPVNNPYEVKPKYSSLVDYLDSKKNKDSGNDRSNKSSDSKQPEKFNSNTSKNRKDFKKREQTESHPFSFGKARSKKSSRKNKTR